MREGVTERARINLKIDAALKEWILEYASRHGVTVTDLICGYFKTLRAKEMRKQPDDLAEQI